MATTDKAREVFKLLADIKGIGTKSEAEVDTSTVKAIQPPRHLIEPFEPSFIDGYELKDPTGHKLTLRAIYEAHVAGENIAATGPTGSGKSSLMFHLLDISNESRRTLNRKIYAENKKRLSEGAKLEDLEPYKELVYTPEHLSCHAETRSAEIIGDIDLVYDDDGNRHPVVRWGHVVKAWTEGKILIAEEIDMPDPGIWAGTHELFDGRTEETDIFLNGVQHIKKHPRFKLLATMNTLLKGENQDEYAGTQVQNTAWINRFGFTVILDYMRPEAELSLIQIKTGLDAGTATKMVTAADKSRESYKEGVVEAPITTRDILAWSREVKRCAARYVIKPDDKDYWARVVVPSAYWTFISRQPDEATRNMYSTFLSLH